MNCSTPGLPVHNQLPEFTQIHVHWVSDAIQPSHPLSSPFSSCPQSFLASGSFPMSQLFAQIISSVQFSLVAQSSPTLCHPMNRSTPGLPVHHQLPEFTQTHVHRVSDAIQPSHPLSSPFPPAPNPSQHMSLFQWVNSSHEVAKVLEFQLYHHSFQRNPRADLLQNFCVCVIHIFVVIHIVKGFGIVNEVEVDVFSGTVLLYQWPKRCWQFDLWFLCFF